MPCRHFLALILLLGWLNGCATLGGLSEAQMAYEQGLALVNQGQYAAAVSPLQRAIDLDANFGKAYLALGRAHLGLGQWLQAIPVIRTAFRLAPAESKGEVTGLLLDGLLGGATASLKSGKFGESIGLFKEALTLSPKTGQVQLQLVEALIGMGGQLLGQGKLTDAIATFSEATQLNPQHVDGYLGLARALWQQGDIFKALAVGQKAMSLAPGDNNVRSLLQQLQGR